MSASRSDYWTDIEFVGTTKVFIEMARFGLLWHGHAARFINGNQIDRHALATAWGADRDQVRRDVLRGVFIALEQREHHHHPGNSKPAVPKDGMFVMGCWHSFSHDPAAKE